MVKNHMLKIDDRKNICISSLFEIVLFALIVLNLFIIEDGFGANNIQGRWVYIVDIALILVGIFKMISLKRRLKFEDIKICFIFCIPYIFLFFWNVFIQILCTDISIKNSTITLAYWIFPILTASISYMAFEERAFEVSTIAVIANYGCVIVKAAMDNGIAYLFDLNTYLNNFGSILEVHEIGLAIGLIILYDFYQIRTCKNQISVRFLLEVMILLMCGKRIAIMGVVAVMLFYELFRKYGIRKQTKIVKVMLILLINMTFIYLIMVQNGILTKFFNFVGINSNTRAEMWLFFSELCDISPFYIGKGLGYSINKLKDMGGILVNGILMPVGDLHNDVFKMYIDAGFIPFVVFWIYFFYGQAKYFVRRSKKTSILFFILVAYTAMLAFTDNVLRYNLFLFIFYLLIYVQNGKEKLERRSENDG